ncbi:hypothetical protein AAVH_23788, partial [Aphelenchoides avenae]
MCFFVSCDEADFCPDRTFNLRRNAAVDSAVAVNHLRNCTAPVADGFGIEFPQIDDSFAPWVNGLLRSAENFRFPKLDVILETTDTAGIIDFMMSTRDAFLGSIGANGLCKISLHTGFDTLERLVEARFLQWPYVQNLEHIQLEL